MCCGGVRLHASTGSAAPPPGEASGTNTTLQKPFEALCKSMTARIEAILEVKAGPMLASRLGGSGLGIHGGSRRKKGQGEKEREKGGREWGVGEEYGKGKWGGDDAV